MLQAVINEREKTVRTAIVTLVGALVNHEFAKKDPWMNDVLKFIFDNCSSEDATLSEVNHYYYYFSLAFSNFVFVAGIFNIFNSYFS